MRQLMCMAWMVVLGACAPDDDPELSPAGEWEVALTCSGGDQIDSTPACVDGDLLLLDVLGDGPFYGDHLSFFPGHARADGAYSGMVGPVSGDFEDGQLVLDVMGDLDYPFASSGDLASWADHHLELRGVFESVCWNATFTWRTREGLVGVEGTAVVSRSGQACR